MAYFQWPCLFQGGLGKWKYHTCFVDVFFGSAPKIDRTLKIVAKNEKAQGFRQKILWLHTRKLTNDNGKFQPFEDVYISYQD